MPKVIKKKSGKVSVGSEEEVRDMLTKASESATPYMRNITIAAIALAMIVAGGIGYKMYQGSQIERARQYEYSGYRNYFGLYERESAVKAERMATALEEFKKAYEIKKSATLLFYIANCQYGMGNLDEAIKTLDRIESEYKGDLNMIPLVYYKKAIVEVKAGRPDNAVKLLETYYIQVKSQSFKDLALIEAGRILEGLGRRDEAKSKYEELARTYGTSMFAQEAGQRLGMLNAAAGVKPAPQAKGIPQVKPAQ